MGVFSFLNPKYWDTQTYLHELIPIDFEPKVANVGASLYSGPQGSLAGSLPSWIAPWSPGIAYQKGHIVYHKANHAAALDLAIVRGSGFSLVPYLYDEENLYVQTEPNLSFTETDTHNVESSPLPENGWKSFKDLSGDGWDVGYGYGQSIQRFRTRYDVPELKHHLIALNLSDTHFSKTDPARPQPHFIVCGSVMKPPVDSDEVEFPLIPSDRITIGGGILRTPTTVSNSAGATHKVISGDYPAYIIPTTMFKPKEAYLDSLNDVSGNDWDAMDLEDQDKYVAYEFNEYNFPSDRIAETVNNKPIPTFHPQYAEGRSSLRAYLSSSYKFATPMADESSVDAWIPGESYKIGSSVAHALNLEDEGIQPANQRGNKDVIWICVKDHDSDATNNPPVVEDVSNYWSHEYWRPYGLVMNAPNSSISLLWDSYKDNQEISGASGAPEATKKLSGTGSTSLRKRVSDMIGGSRLYANLTISPSRRGTRKEIARRGAGKGRTRYHSIYGIIAPGGIADTAERDGARADLWLYPNTLKKDHAGQIRYAVQFGDRTTFSPTKIKQDFWTRFTMSMMFWRRYKRRWSYMPEPRKDPAAYIKTIKGLETSDSPARRAAARLTSTYGFLMGNDTKISDEFDAAYLDGTQEVDIIRYSFTALKPWHESPGVTSVFGQYTVLIEDLNSGNLISTKFAYEDIARRGNDFRVDSFGNTHHGYGNNNSMNQHPGYNSEYIEAADKIVKVQNDGDVVGDSLKLIATRNHFNYLILGHASASDSSSEALKVKSMDMTEDQFRRCVGLIQTGFGGVTLHNEDENDDTTVSKGQLKMVEDQDMLHVLEVPPSVEDGNFIVGGDISASSNEYIDQLEITAEASPWEGGKYYDASEVVRNNNRNYFALKCHTSPSSFSAGSNWKEIDQIDYGIKKPEPLSNDLSTKDAWAKVISSSKLEDDQKLAFTVDWSPSISPLIFPAFFLGTGCPGQNFAANLALLYKPGMIAKAEIIAPFDGPGVLYANADSAYAWGGHTFQANQLMISRSEKASLSLEDSLKFVIFENLPVYQNNCRFLYKLKKAIPGIGEDGTVPGYVGDAYWKVLPGLSSNVFSNWWASNSASAWRDSWLEHLATYSNPASSPFFGPLHADPEEDDTAPFLAKVAEMVGMLHPNKNWRGEWALGTEYSLNDIASIQFEVKDGGVVVDYHTIVMEYINYMPSTATEKPFNLDKLENDPSGFIAANTNSSVNDLLSVYGETNDVVEMLSASLPVDTEYWEFIPSSQGPKSHGFRFDTSFLFPCQVGLFDTAEFYKGMDVIWNHQTINPANYNANVRNITPGMLFPMGSLPTFGSVLSANSSLIPGSPPLRMMLTESEGGNLVNGTWPSSPHLPKEAFKEKAPGTNATGDVFEKFNTGNVVIDNLLVKAADPEDINFDFEEVLGYNKDVWRRIADETVIKTQAEYALLPADDSTGETDHKELYFEGKLHNDLTELETRIRFIRNSPGYGPEGTFIEASLLSGSISPRIIKHKKMDIDLYASLKVVGGGGLISTLNSDLGKNLQCAIVCIPRTNKRGIEHHEWEIADASGNTVVNESLTKTLGETYRERNKLIPLNCTVKVEADDLSKVILIPGGGDPNDLYLGNPIGYLHGGPSLRTAADGSGPPLNFTNHFLTIDGHMKRVTGDSGPDSGVDPTYVVVESAFPSAIEETTAYVQFGNVDSDGVNNPHVGWLCDVNSLGPRHDPEGYWDDVHERRRPVFGEDTFAGGAWPENGFGGSSFGSSPVLKFFPRAASNFFNGFGSSFYDESGLKLLSKLKLGEIPSEFSDNSYTYQIGVLVYDKNSKRDDAFVQFFLDNGNTVPLDGENFALSEKIRTEIFEGKSDWSERFGGEVKKWFDLGSLSKITRHMLKEATDMQGIESLYGLDLLSSTVLGDAWDETAMMDGLLEWQQKTPAMTSVDVSFTEVTFVSEPYFVLNPPNYIKDSNDDFRYFFYNGIDSGLEVKVKIPLLSEDEGLLAETSMKSGRVQFKKAGVVHSFEEYSGVTDPSTGENRQVAEQVLPYALASFGSSISTNTALTIALEDDVGPGVSLLGDAVLTDPPFIGNFGLAYKENQYWFYDPANDDYDVVASYPAFQYTGRPVVFKVGSAEENPSEIQYSYGLNKSHVINGKVTFELSDELNLAVNSAGDTIVKIEKDAALIDRALITSGPANFIDGKMYFYSTRDDEFPYTSSFGVGAPFDNSVVISPAGSSPAVLDKVKKEHFQDETNFTLTISDGVGIDDTYGTASISGTVKFILPPSMTSFGSALVSDRYWFYSSAQDTSDVTASYPAGTGTFKVKDSTDTVTETEHSFVLNKDHIDGGKVTFELNDGLGLPLNDDGGTSVVVEKDAELIADTEFASEPANFIGGTMYFYSGRDDEYTYVSSFGVSSPFVASATISPAGSSPAVLNKVKQGNFLNSSLVNGGSFSLTISDGTGLNDTYGTASISGTVKRIDPVSTPVITIPVGEVGSWGSCSVPGYDTKEACEAPGVGGTWTSVPGQESVKYLSPDAFTVRASYDDTGFSDFPEMGSLKLEVTNRAGAIDESTIGPIDFSDKTSTTADHVVNSTSFGGDINLQVTISDGILDSTNLGLDRVATAGPYRIASRPGTNLKPDYSIRAGGSGNQLRWWAHKHTVGIKSEVHVSISDNSFLLHPSAYGDDRLQKSVAEVTDLASNTKPLDATYDGSASEFLNSVEFFPASQENPIARFQAQLGDGQETLGKMVNWLQGEHPNTGVKTVVFGQVDLSLVGEELIEGSSFARSEVPETVFLNAPGNVYVGDDLFIMSRNPGYQVLNWEPPNKQILGTAADLYGSLYGGTTNWWDVVGEREALCADEDGAEIYYNWAQQSPPQWTNSSPWDPGDVAWDGGTFWRNKSGSSIAASIFPPSSLFRQQKLADQGREASIDILDDFPDDITPWENIFAESQPYTKRRDFDIIDSSEVFGENGDWIAAGPSWNNRPYKAFSGLNGNLDSSATGQGWRMMLKNEYGLYPDGEIYEDPPFPHYFTVKFDQKWRISKYQFEVTLHYDNNFSDGSFQHAYPDDWTLEGSDDNVNWTTIDAVNNHGIWEWEKIDDGTIISSSDYHGLSSDAERAQYKNEFKTFEVNSPGSSGYLYYRFSITRAVNSKGYTGEASNMDSKMLYIKTFKFLGTPCVAQFYSNYIPEWSHDKQFIANINPVRHFVPLKNSTTGDSRGNLVHFFPSSNTLGDIPGDASEWEKIGVTWHTTHGGGADTPSSVLRIAGRHDTASPAADTYQGIWPIIDGEPLALDAPLTEETAILVYDAYRAPQNNFYNRDSDIGYADAAGLEHWVDIGGSLLPLIDGLNAEDNGVTFEIIEGGERATHQMQGHPYSDSVGVNFPKNIAKQYDYAGHLHIASNDDLLTFYNNYNWVYSGEEGLVPANSKTEWEFGKSHYERHGWYEGRSINKIFKANMEFESAHEGGDGQDTSLGGAFHYDYEKDMPYLALVHQNNSLINNYEDFPWVSQYLDGLSIGQEYEVTLYDQEWLPADGSQMLVTIESVGEPNFEFERTSGITSDEWSKWSFKFTADMKDPFIKLAFTGGASHAGAWLIRGLKVERTYKIDDVEVFEIEGPKIDSPITAMDCGEIDGIKAFHSGSKGTLSAYMGDYKLFGSNDIWQELDSNGEAIPGLAPNWFDDPSESEYNYSWVRPYFKLGSVTGTHTYDGASTSVTLAQYPLAAPTAWDYPTKIGTWSNFDPPAKLSHVSSALTWSGIFSRSLLDSFTTLPGEAVVLELDPDYYKAGNKPTEYNRIEDSMRTLVVGSKLALHDGIGKITLESDSWGVDTSNIDDIFIIRPGEINLYPDWAPGVLYKKGEGIRVRDEHDRAGDQYFVCIKEHLSTNDSGTGLASDYNLIEVHYEWEGSHVYSRSFMHDWYADASKLHKGGYHSGNRGSKLYWSQQSAARPIPAQLNAGYVFTNVNANALYSGEGLEELAAFMKENSLWSADKIGDLQSGEKLVEMGSDLHRRILTRVGSNKSRILFAESPSSEKTSIVQVDLSPSRDVDEWNTYPSMVAPFDHPSLIYFGDASAGGILGDELISSIDVSDLDWWNSTASAVGSNLADRLNYIIKKENLSLLIVDDFVEDSLDADTRYSSVFIYCPPKPSIRLFPSIVGDSLLSNYEASEYDWFSRIINYAGYVTSPGILDRDKKIWLIEGLYNKDGTLLDDRFPNGTVRNKMFLPSEMYNVWSTEFGRPVEGLNGGGVFAENIEWESKRTTSYSDGEKPNDRRWRTGDQDPIAGLSEVWGLSEGGTDDSLSFDEATGESDGNWGYIGLGQVNDRFARDSGLAPFYSDSLNRGLAAPLYSDLRGWWGGIGDVASPGGYRGIDTTWGFDINAFSPDSVAEIPGDTSGELGRIWGGGYGGYNGRATCDGILIIKNNATDWGSPNAGPDINYLIGIQAICKQPNFMQTDCPDDIFMVGHMYRVSVKVAIPGAIPYGASRRLSETYPNTYSDPSPSVQFDAFVDISSKEDSSVADGFASLEIDYSTIEGEVPQFSDRQIAHSGWGTGERMGSWSIDHTDFREYAFYFTATDGGGKHRIRLQNSSKDPIVTTWPGTRTPSSDREFIGHSGQSILLFADFKVELCSPYHVMADDAYLTSFTLEGRSQVNISSEPGEPPLQHPAEIGNLPAPSMWPYDPAFAAGDKLIETSFQYPHIKEYIFPPGSAGYNDQRPVEVGSLILYEAPKDQPANPSLPLELKADAGGRKVLYERRESAATIYKPSHPYGWNDALSDPEFGRWKCLEYEYDDPEPLVDPDRVKCISKIEVQDQTGQTTGFEIDVYKRNPRRSGFTSEAFTKETSTVDATSHSLGKNRLALNNELASGFDSFQGVPNGQTGDTIRISIARDSFNPPFFPYYFPHFGCLEPQGAGPREDSMYSLTGMPLNLHPVDLGVPGATPWKHAQSNSVFYGSYPDGSALSGVTDEYYWKKARGGRHLAQGYAPHSASEVLRILKQTEVNGSPELVRYDSPGGAASYMSHVLFKKTGADSDQWVKIFELRFQLVKADGTLFSFITNPVTPQSGEPSMENGEGEMGWHDISDYRNELDWGDTGPNENFKEFGTIELHKVYKEAGGASADVHSLSMFNTLGPQVSELTLRCYAINHAAMTLRNFTGADGYHAENSYGNGNFDDRSLLNEREVYPYSYGPIEIPLA